MQTGEMGFSLEMNRLRDNDPDDRLLLLTFRVVSGRPCCVYRQQTHIFFFKSFFKAAAVKLCAHPGNAQLSQQSSRIRKRGNHFVGGLVALGGQ